MTSYQETALDIQLGTDHLTFRLLGGGWGGGGGEVGVRGILFSLCPSVCTSVTFWSLRGYLISTAYWHPVGTQRLKWRRINVSATWSRRIDVWYDVVLMLFACLAIFLFLMVSIQGKKSQPTTFWNICLIFPSKLSLTYTQFVSNVKAYFTICINIKAYFLGKIIEETHHQLVICWICTKWLSKLAAEK